MGNSVLFCATVDFHFSSFHLAYLEWFKRQNWEVHVAANGDMELPHVDFKHRIPIERSPTHWNNRLAYRQLKELIDKHQYQIIHCHTPMGGALARLAARAARRKGTKVIYTAHGFHFCRGAPLKNWLLYYPAEKYLARHTDCLITINNEDYRRALDHQFKAKKIARVHGVGVDTNRFCPISHAERLQLRESFGYSAYDVLLFYAAEFNANKNHQLLIRALAEIKDQAPAAKLLLAGAGPLQQTCRQLAAALGVEERVHFLGFRTDIDRLLPMCDIAVSSSLREGLPVNIMEAMACGLPVIATRNRGHEELITDDYNGCLVEPGDRYGFADAILKLLQSSLLRRRMGSRSLQLMDKYSLRKVSRELTGIYSDYMMGDRNDETSLDRVYADI